MQFEVLTLFPDLIYNYCNESILGRAQLAGAMLVRAHNFRKFALNKMGHVDDKPYGGGPGMVLQVPPIYDCLKSIKALKSQRTGRKKCKVIIMDPAGKTFDQPMAEKFSELDQLVVICGRYEGFDARVYEFVDERVSVGNFVLAGGELAALAVIEATARLLPGVLGNPESLKEETFGQNVQYSMINDQPSSKSKKSQLDIEHWTLNIFHEYPQYTRPENFMGMKVPKVLMSGNHKEIDEWRKSKMVDLSMKKNKVKK